MERASHDPKAVITTYEGKHNHDVPTARNSTHEFAGTAAYSGTSKTRAQDSSSISLDLGVGIGQGLETESIRSQIASNKVQMGVCYDDIVNGGGLNLYGNRENRVEAHHNFQTPPINASNQCQQNLGRILMGP